MESWFQRLLLALRNKALTILCITLSATLFFAQPNSLLADSDAANTDTSTNDMTSVDSEYFDVGVFTGIMNIEDFNSEFVVGGNITFNANEDFFMQFNYLQTDASLSSYEKVEGPYFSGSDRDFTHFDFLVGYNLLLGEHFLTGTQAKLSSVYVVAGIGDTEFGGEGSFTYTVGMGYQMALQRNILLRLDFRDYIYKTNIIGEDKSVHNTQLSANVSYLF